MILRRSRTFKSIVLGARFPGTPDQILGISLRDSVPENGLFLVRDVRALDLHRATCATASELDKAILVLVRQVDEHINVGLSVKLP
jgi:hypothetical protein